MKFDYDQPPECPYLRADGTCKISENKSCENCTSIDAINDYNDGIADDAYKQNKENN